MLKIEKKKKDVEIFGQVYSLNKPSFDETEEVQAKLADEKDGNKVLKIMREFMANLGLPNEIIGQLDMDSFNELLAYLTGSKKN